MTDLPAVLTGLRWDLQAVTWPAGGGGVGDDFELMPGEIIHLKLELVGVLNGLTCGLEPQACP